MGELITREVLFLEFTNDEFAKRTIFFFLNDLLVVSFQRDLRLMPEWFTNSECHETSLFVKGLLLVLLLG